MLPTEWRKFISGAFRFMRANEAVFNKMPSVENTAVLAHLLCGDNPLLSLASARTLMSDPSNLPLVEKELSRANGIRQAALALIILRSIKLESLEHFDATISDMLVKAERVEDLHGLALAAYWAGKRHDGDVADDMLLGMAGLDYLKTLSVGDRYQPVLLRRIIRSFVEFDPNFSDNYVSILVRLGERK